MAVDKREVLLAEGFQNIIDVIWSAILEPRAEVIVLDFVPFAENFNALEILCVDGDLPALLAQGSWLVARLLVQLLSGLFSLAWSPLNSSCHPPSRPRRVCRQAIEMIIR